MVKTTGTPVRDTLFRDCLRAQQPAAAERSEAVRFFKLRPATSCVNQEMVLGLKMVEIVAFFLATSPNLPQWKTEAASLVVIGDHLSQIWLKAETTNESSCTAKD